MLISQTELSSVSGLAAHTETVIDPRSVVDAGAQVGPGSRIGPHAFVEAQASVGANCVVESGVHICRGTVVEDEVHIGAHAAFASAPGHAAPPATVKRGAWIGANASILAGVTIGAKAVVRPGSVVTRSVPPAAIVEGNPASIVGYIDTMSVGAAPIAAPKPGLAVEQTPVRGVTVHNFPVIPDLRGNLTVGEFERQIPFKPLRYFIVFGVPSREIRGEHAHRECHQFLICLRGSCAVVADDGERKIEITLDAPERGLYLPPMTWGIQYKYSSDAMLMVFASDYYDSADYVRDYAEFTQLIAQRKVSH